MSETPPGRPAPLILPLPGPEHEPVLLAAFEAGIPVVAPETPAARALLGMGGLTVPPSENWSGLAQAAESLAADAAQQEQVVRRGRAEGRRLRRRLFPPAAPSIPDTPPVPAAVSTPPPPVPVQGRSRIPAPPRGPGSGQRLLVLRDGGIGDLVLLTPALRELARLDYRVTLACDARWVPLFQSHPALTAVVDYREPLPEVDEEVNLIRGVDFLGDHPRALREHRTDLFCAALGVAPADLRPDLHLTPEARAWAERYCQDLGEFAVVQYRATSPYRTYPHMARVCQLLAQHLPVVAVSDEPWAERPAGCRDLCGQAPIAQVAAVISRAAVVVGPDSGAIHLAGALGVPVVGVFGPYPPDLRLRYYGWKRAVRSAPECPPCFEDPVYCGKLPPPCLADTDPEEVVRTTLALLRLVQTTR